MFYIYKITNKVNEKVYIGKTNEPDKRWKKHCLIALKPNSDRHHLIHKAIAKYGADNFSFEIIEKCKSETKSFKQERYWISYYKSNACRYRSKFGYNLTDGGEGATGFVPTKQSRKRMSDSHIGLQTGENHPCTSLTEKNVNDIFQMIIDNNNDQDIANTFLVNRKVISSIRLGKSWTCIQRPPEMEQFSISERKLTDNIVREIKRLLLQKVSGKAIAKQFSVSAATISGIKNGNTWKHIV
jgi:group I intron endonuclease